ncbi:carbohydrate ABC transporter permease [Nocardioides sp.]|uniref:carbohydrate ABC transporter permease n=1 Tax=Nocardioides sp. TaxID=35761 RepID=UPI003528277C
MTTLLNRAAGPRPPRARARERRERERPQRWFRRLVLTPSLAYLAFFTLLPLVWVGALALFSYSPRREGSGPGGLGGANPFVGLDNFTAMFDTSGANPLADAFRGSLVTTLLFAFLVLPLNLMITLPLAAMIESVARRLRPLFRTLFFMPVLTSAVAVAVIWSYVLNPQFGLANSMLTKVRGVSTVIAWINDPSLVVLGIPVALLAVTAAYLWMDIGYNLVIFIAALQGIPSSVTEAAVLDGANAWQRFRHITLPMLKPTIMLTAVLTMISSFQAFDLFQVMTLGGPDRQTRVLALDIYENAFRFQAMGWAAAESLVLMVLVLAIALIQSRLLRTSWEY